jgi:Leucine-rich repeat (LRR) protein
MIKKLLFSISICLGMSLNAQTTAIPDSNFEQALIDQGIDSDGIINGSVLTSDVASLSYLNIMDSNISNISGLESFISLNSLNASGNSITNIDLSQNTYLSDLDLLDNAITSIDLSQNIFLSFLRIENNQIENIDISNNTFLQFAYLNNNKLSSINLQFNTNLLELRLNNNQINSIDISNNTILNVLELRKNEFNQLNLSNNPDLLVLDIGENNFNFIDLSNNLKLNDLRINDNNINSLDLTNHTELYTFRAENNSLTSLNIQNGTNRQLGTFFPDIIYRFNIENNPNLFCVLVDDITYSNQYWISKDSQTIYSQNVSNCSTCEEIVIPDPNFEQFLVDSAIDTDGSINGSICRVDAEAAKTLEILDFESRGINSVNLSGIEAFINLETLQIAPKLFPGHTNAIGYDTDRFLIENLDTNSMENLKNLIVRNTNLQTIDISNNVNLISFSGRSNEFSSIDFSNNIKLEGIDIRDNFFINLDLSMNPNIYRLEVNDNNLETLNIKNGNIERIVWAANNSNLSCITVDDEDNSTRTFHPSYLKGGEIENFGGNPAWQLDSQTDLKENCTPLLDTVTNLNGPNNVIPGQEITITVDYTATTDRDLVIAFQQENPYAYIASQLISIPSGSGSVEFTFVVPSNVNVIEEHNYVTFITEKGSSNPWGNKFDVQRENVIINGASTIIDTVDQLTAPQNINPGQEITISLNYTATTSRNIVLAFQQENPYSEIKSEIINVAAGSGTVNFTFNVPNTLNTSNDHSYVAYITKETTSNPWGDKFDVVTKSVSISSSISIPLRASILEEDNNLETSIQIFPNPVIDILNVNLPFYPSKINLRLINSSGITIYQNILPAETRNLQIDLSSQISGFYLLEVKNSSGSEVIKVIKK